jgi:tetratricopeptide (TPR) repeat protein
MGKTENIIQAAVIILLALFIGTQPLTAKKKSDEVDYLSLAALLIKDGFYDRAETALISVDEEQLKKQALEEEDNTRLIRYYTFTGLIHLKKKRFGQAAVSLEKSIKSGSEDVLVRVYLVQAYYGQRNFKRTVVTIKKYPQVLKEYYKIYGIYAQSLWNLDLKGEAYNVLQVALKNHPKEKAFVRQELFFLIGLKLYQTALERAQDFLATEELSKDDYITIGRALRKAGQAKKALPLLERGLLTYPDDQNIRLELSGCYHDSSMNYTAAVIMEKASYEDPELIAQTAELYRRAKRYVKALFLNMSIPDQKEKLKQRLAYYVEMGEYESVAAMYTDASRSGLLENEDIVYAFAYSFFMTGNFDDSEMLLTRITRNDLFRKAAELRKSMEVCKEDPKGCI